jgi:hypothetical protein
MGWWLPVANLSQLALLEVAGQLITLSLIGHQPPIQIREFLLLVLELLLSRSLFSTEPKEPTWAKPVTLCSPTLSKSVRRLTRLANSVSLGALTI